MKGKPVNDNATAFETFLNGYWNQMAPDIYPDFGAALADYQAMEGESRYQQLRAELIELRRQSVFPTLAAIEDAYDNPLWSRFSMIVTSEDINSVEL